MVKFFWRLRWALIQEAILEWGFNMRMDLAATHRGEIVAEELSTLHELSGRERALKTFEIIIRRWNFGNATHAITNWRTGL